VVDIAGAPLAPTCCRWVGLPLTHAFDHVNLQNTGMRTTRRQGRDM
jgi:hypothetical protein